MAIQDSFNLSNALNSQAYAYKCWYNYNYGNNTMGISAQDMGEITQTWNGELANWRATAVDDENAYEIEDDDFSTARQNGENQAKDATGYDGKQGGQITRTVVDSVAGVGGGVLATGALNSALSGVSEGIGKTIGNGWSKIIGEKAANKGASKAMSNGVTNKASKASWIIAAPLSLATGTAYTAKKPNKDEKEACDTLQDEMVNSQNALYSAQEDMSAASDEVTALSDEVQTYNDEGNEAIEEKKSEYDTYKASYDALMEKIKAGETLTDSEKELLEELIPLMQELGLGIQDTQEETTEVAEDIYDEMGSYQADYDNAASTVAEVQGVTDYAESFDESTRTMCYVEAGAQTLNAASGAKAAYQAGAFASSGGLFTAWAWGFAAMGAAGAGISGYGAAEQFKWGNEVGTEIDMRKMTQDLNSTTNDIYDESIEGYEGAMVGVEEMELAIPEGMENPEEVVEQLSEESSEVLAGAEIPEADGATSGNVLTNGTFGLTAGTRTTNGNNTGGEAGTNGVNSASGSINPNEKDKEEK